MSISNLTNCLYYKRPPDFESLAEDEEAWLSRHLDSGFKVPRVSMETISIKSIPDRALMIPMESPNKSDDREQQQKFLEACQKGDLVTVPSMLENKNLDLDFVDPRGFTPLQHTIKNGHEELCRMLIADPRINLTDSLHTAVENGKDLIARMFLESGMSPNEPAVSEVFAPGVTPLLLACLDDNAASIQLLLG